MPLGPPKQRAVLARLLVRANEAVPVGRLIDELWPEAPPASARHAVQVYVSRLRKAVGDPARLAAGAGAYALRVEPDELDLERFRSLVAQASAQLGAEPAAAGRQLREALSLWRGRALADLDGEPGVRSIVLELEEERLQATELLLEAELTAGRHAEVVPELERLLAEHPARETLYELLMLALYRSGRQAAGLDVYRRARSGLRNELGLEPGPQLRELQSAILRQDPSLTIEPAELRARRHLPAQDAPPDGREHELVELTELVASGGVRVVTLTGPAGAGKTPLAIAAAARLPASFADGVWFVDVSAGAAVTAIAETLGIPEETLAGHLAAKELLLVLDGCEHLRTAAMFLSSLLRAAPRLKLLVTSRERLNLYGEHEYRLADA